MKKLFFSVIILISGISANCQNTEVSAGVYCDTVICSHPEYPVRLQTDIKDLTTYLESNLVLYPEDKVADAVYEYRFRVNCLGRNIASEIVTADGPVGLSRRILIILNDRCEWGPAINLEKPVTSSYELTVNLKKGKLEIIPEPKRTKK